MQAAQEHIRLPEGHSFRILRWTQSVREIECILGPGVAVRMTGEGTHWHYHQAMELTLFTAGFGTRFVGDHIGAFEAGDLVMLGEKLPHYWHAAGPCSGFSLQWYFPESHPFWAFPETAPLAGLFRRADRGIRLSGRLALDVGRQMREMAGQSGVQQLSGLLSLLGRVARGGAGELELLSVRSFALPAGSRHRQAIAEAVRHLVAHFREEVRLEDVLELTGMSRPTFARQFKEHSGRTFSEFLNGLRMQAACQELAEGNRSVMDTAMGCGFSQISFFNRLFRKKNGCSPLEYRAAAGGKSAG